MEVNFKNTGFVEILTLVFIVLKLTNIINWSWWWVLSPIWMSMVFVLIFGLVVMFIKRKKRSKNNG